MKILFEFALPKFTFLGLLFKKPVVLLSTVPAVVAVKITNVVRFESVAWILFWLFVADWVTGVLASYFEWKGKGNKKDEWFFGNGEGFSSDKFKKMIFKGIAYAGLPLILIRFQHVLMLKNFKYERLSDAEFEWATIAILVFCMNEGFSIFHENLPKCGFNLWERIKKMIGFYKDFKNKISE